MHGELVLVWGALWTENPLPGKLIILAILGLLLRGVLIGNRELKRYAEEKVYLRRMAETLAEWRHTIAVRDAYDQPMEQHPAAATAGAEGALAEESTGKTSLEPQGATGDLGRHPHLIGEDPLLEGIRRTSLVGERALAIFKMRTYRVKVNLEILQQLTIRRDESAPGWGYLPFAANLAMMLGILGTFIGLAVMVQQIHLGLPRDPQGAALDTWVSSLSNLKSVLGGMKTAFSTSLLGIVTAVVASSLDHRVRSERKALFEGLERLTAEELLPATVPAVEDELLLERVSFQLEESFSRLDEIVRQNRETLRDLTATQEAFVEIVGEVRSITRGQSARNLDSVIDLAGNANEAVLQVAAQLPKLASSMEATGLRIERLVRESVRHHSSANPVRTGRLLGLQPKSWVAILLALAVGLVLLQMVSLG